MTTVPHSTQGTDASRACGLGRRAVAMLYDGLLLVGIWMIAAVIVVVPTNQGVAPHTVWFQLYLLIVTWLYFAISWRAGCTLGMKAWHVRIQSPTGSMSWLTTAIRFIVALASLGSFGLGFFWSIFHPAKATWHDLASNTFLRVIPKSSTRQQKKRQHANDQSGQSRP